MSILAEGIMLLLSEVDHGGALTAGAIIAEPTPGRPMKDYVVLPRTILEDSPS